MVGRGLDGINGNVCIEVTCDTDGPGVSGASAAAASAALSGHGRYYHMLTCEMVNHLECSG